jgi:hypothetical protein
MRPVGVVHHGSILACAFIFGPESMRELDARMRILDRFQHGSALFELPDGRWLLTLEKPVRVDADDAPGLAVDVEWSTAPRVFDPADAPGQLAGFRAGARFAVDRSSLRPADPSIWLDLGVPSLETSPLEAPAVSAVAIAPADAPPVNLRAAAKIGSDATVQAKAAELAQAAQRAEQRAQRRARRQVQPSRTGRAGSGSQSGFGRTSPKERRHFFGDAWRRGVLRTPAAQRVGRKHRQYLDDLEQRFRRGDLDEALRRSLPLGSLGGAGRLSLGTPGRRDQLDITGGWGGGGTVPYGADVQSKLTELYRAAATKLEQEGRFTEAAFVLAELLRLPQECVTMLERHKEFRLAAQVASTFDLDSALRVKLLWLAGERIGALSVARRYSVFETAIALVAPVSPEAAVALRTQWVDVLERSGDVRGAVRAAWPELTLRPFLINLLRDAVHGEDADHADLCAYLLSIDPSAEQLTRFESTVSDICRTRPDRFPALLDGIVRADRIPDRSIDRRAVGYVQRCALAGNVPLTKPAYETLRKLRTRTDVTLVADLPNPGLGAPAKPTLVRVTVGAGDGVVPLDVVAIGRRLLVARGVMGVSLVTAAGAIAARWATRTDRIVVSDSGTSALLLTDLGSRVDVTVLDLRTRKTRFYGTVEAWQWAHSFDGSTWAVVTGTGITYLDMTADRPTSVWTELSAPDRCLSFDRNDRQTAAIVQTPLGVEVWQWITATRRLAFRKSVEPVAGFERMSLGSDGWTLHTTAAGVAVLRSDAGTLSQPMNVPNAVLVDGALVASGFEGDVAVWTYSASTSASTSGSNEVQFVGVAQLSELSLRSARVTHGALVIVGTSGSVVVIDRMTNELRWCGPLPG